VISPDERASLFEALPIRTRLVAETLYVTGARVSEVLGVRLDQVKVNSTNGAVELRLYGKGGKERTSRMIPRSSTGGSWPSSPRAPTCLSRERGNTSRGSMSPGRSHGRPGECSGDPSRRTCFDTPERRTCWRRRTG